MDLVDRKPKISVIMSVYKEPLAILKKSIESILNQSFEDFEFIIVNDNPTRRDLKGFLYNYQKRDKRIIILENPTNLGLALSLNRALSVSKGIYIARMDADDIALPYRLEYQLSFLTEEKKYSLIGGWIYLIDEKDNVIGTRKLPTEFLSLKKRLKQCKTAIFHPTWFGTREIFQTLGGYRNLKYSQDFDFLLRAVLKGFLIGNISDYILKYRIYSTLNEEKVLLQYIITQNLCKAFNKHQEASLTLINQAVNKILNSRIKSRLLIKSLIFLYKGLEERKKRNYLHFLLYMLGSFILYPSVIRFKLSKI